MNTRRLLFLSALCLTMGTTQVSAQSFLKKIKNKGRLSGKILGSFFSFIVFCIFAL